MNTISLLLAVPLLSAFLSGVLPRSRQTLIEYAAICVGLLEVVLVLFSISSIQAGTLAATPLFATDMLGGFVLLFASIVGLAAAIHSVGHLREEMRKGIIGFRRIRQYFFLFHLFFFAMFTAAATSSPLIMWISIEATTLASAFLITFYNKPSALEAGWKHLIVNSAGLLLGFLGTLLFLNAAASAGTADTFVSWDTLHSLSHNFDPLLIKLAFVFVLVGFGTKVGFVPMHTWLPDAHSKAPVPISSLLSGVLLNVALIAILRFRSVTDSVVDPHFTQTLLLTFGIVSLVLSAFIIFVQKNYKRMLAYSSIEHMGVMGLGFGFGGVASVAALYHMFYHALLKPILFFCAGNFFLKYSSTKIKMVRGALTLLPVTSVVFFAGLLAISGIPPSGIFFTKLTILSEGMIHYPILTIVAIMALAIVFAGFIRHSMNMLFSEPPADLRRGEAGLWTLASIVFLSTLFVVLSFWIPQPFHELIAAASSIIK